MQGRSACWGAPLLDLYKGVLSPSISVTASKVSVSSPPQNGFPKFGPSQCLDGWPRLPKGSFTSSIRTLLDVARQKMSDRVTSGSLFDTDDRVARVTEPQIIDLTYDPEGGGSAITAAAAASPRSVEALHSLSVRGSPRTERLCTKRAGEAALQATAIAATNTCSACPADSPTQTTGGSFHPALNPTLCHTFHVAWPIRKPRHPHA